MSAPLYKIPMLLSAAVAFHKAATPPNPPPSGQETKKYEVERNVRRILVRQLPAIYKSTFWLACLCEVITILASHYPSQPMSVKALSNLSGGYPKSAAGITITSAFVAGWVLALFGGWIRRKCYQTLGRLFTFELAIRKDHHLVTSGPYSFVRHPSYTGTISAMAGTLLVGLTPGSWLRECGLLQSWIGRVIAGIWILNAVFFCGLVGCRTRQEDEALRKEFGGVWDKWASEVRYRLVPFVY